MISRNGGSNPVLSLPAKLAVWLVVGIAITGILSGCQSPTVGDDWPYKGVPMVGTNTIPVPKW
jgi:hypothetical protein